MNYKTHFYKLHLFQFSHCVHIASNKYSMRRITVWYFVSPLMVTDLWLLSHLIMTYIPPRDATCMFRYCVTAWNKCVCLLISLSYHKTTCNDLHPHSSIYTQAVGIADTAEQNLQLDLTFIGLDNQITREIKKGLQGMRMKKAGKMSPVYNCV